MEGQKGRVSYCDILWSFKILSISVYGIFHNPPFLISSFPFLKSNYGALTDQHLPPVLIRLLKSSSSKLFFSHRTFHMLGRKSLENPTDGFIPPPPLHSMQTIHFQFLTSRQVQKRNLQLGLVCLCVYVYLCVFRRIWRLSKEDSIIFLFYSSHVKQYQSQPSKFLFQISYIFSRVRFLWLVYNSYI